MNHTGLTMAVVDDDDSVRIALRQLLCAAQFGALSFSSAEEFLGSRDVEHVDCLIVDVNLPGMSGVALVRALTAAGRSIPVVLISARDDPTTLALIRAADRVPYLRKPFSDDELFAAIAEAVEK